MSYATHFPWLRHGFVRIQGAERVIERLPNTESRRRVLEHLEAAERALNELDTELQPPEAATCIDCGSDLHGTDHPSCPEQHDCED